MPETRPLFRVLCVFIIIAVSVLFGGIFFLKRNSNVTVIERTVEDFSKIKLTYVNRTLTLDLSFNSSTTNDRGVAYVNSENYSEFVSDLSSYPEPPDDPQDGRVWWDPPRPVSDFGITDWTKPEGSTWKNGFCKNFIVDTFDKSSEVCSNSREVTCYGSSRNNKMGTCTVINLAVAPKLLHKAFATRSVMSSKCAWLVSQDCPGSHFNDLEKFMESPDPFRSLVKVLALQGSQGKCEVWVKGTTFFYMGMGDHIYFRMLGWYNLHRSLLKHSNLSYFTIIRLPESNSKFWFPEFEKALYPQSVGIEEFKEKVVCFEKVILVPWAYAATPFRCKMEGPGLKRQCMECSGKGLETDLLSFRRKVLSACSLYDGRLTNTKKKTFLVIQRKAYIRRLGDTQTKFQRVWSNSEELIEKLRATFPDDEVVGMFGEQLELCAQVQRAHSANVLIGMHGAGMVHLWWLQPGTISFELVPNSQRGNGAFTTLSTLLGKRHHQFTGVREKGSTVTVDIDRLVKEVQFQLSHLS